MKEVGEVPPRHVAGPLLADVLVVVGAEELHAHHGKDEDDDAQDKSLNEIKTLFNKKCSFWAAAIALWFRLRLPSCGCRFESQAHHLCFVQFELLKL